MHPNIAFKPLCFGEMGDCNHMTIFMLIQKFKRTMRAIQGAMIVASTLQIVLGFSGLWRNVTRLVQI